MVNLANETIMLMRMGEPYGIMAHEPDVVFETYFRLWCKMRRLEEHGVRVYDVMNRAFEDMQLRDAYSAFRGLVSSSSTWLDYSGRPCDEPLFGIRIKWDTGEMSIDLNSFFPCEDWRLAKLLEIIKLDVNYEMLIVRLRMFFLKRIMSCEIECERFRDKFVKQMALVRSIESMLRKKALADGTPMDKNQLKYYRMNFCNEKGLLYRYMAMSQEAMQKREWFSQHIREVTL